MDNMNDIRNIIDIGEIAELLDQNRIASHLYKTRYHPIVSFTDIVFHNRFRFTKHAVLYISRRITDDDETEETRGDRIPTIDRLLTFLRYCATGSVQTVVGELMGIHDSTVSKIIDEISTKLSELFHDFIKPPTPSEQEIISQKFMDKYGFPNIVGIIDGTQVPTNAKKGERAELFRNRKGYPSINCQFVCDCDMVIWDFVARWYGSVHDSTIFNFSSLKTLCENGYFGEKYMLGDLGYANTNYCLTSIRNPSTPAEVIYNRKHKKPRQLVERAIGVWKSRFPVLYYRSRLCLKNTLKVITATAVLHNIAMELKEPMPTRRYRSGNRRRLNSPFPDFRIQGEARSQNTRRNQVVAQIAQMQL